MKGHLLTYSIATMLLAGVLASCSTSKNTSGSRFYHAMTARFNTLYNGRVAFNEGVEAQERGHRDNYNELLPVFIEADKKTAAAGKSQFETAVTKSEKAIKRHSIKRKPKKPSGRMSAKQKAYFNRHEFNPYLHRAWMMFADAQFHQGNFIEAASSYDYIYRLYQGQPEIAGMARAKLARCYVLLEWPYDAEDIFTKLRRDTLTNKTQRELDASLAAHLITTEQYAAAIPPLTNAAKHASSKLQRARLYYLLGQLQARLGHKEEAYKALRKCVRLNPPYELAFNARILQTEVMADGQGKAMIRRLNRMARNPNNADYLDRIYYAIGNIHLASRDTMRTIYAWKKGIEESTQNSFAKAVLYRHLGELYWERENYIDARECYDGLLALTDKGHKDYAEISRRTKALDEVEPHLSAVKLQDSLQVLAQLPEKERLAAIDRVIDELKKKEKEQAKREDAQAANAARTAAAKANTANAANRNAAGGARNGQSATFYFYNPMTVNQGKQDFQRRWGKRANEDNWRRSNKAVNANGDFEAIDYAAEDSLAAMGGDLAADSISAEEQALRDSLANDPHHREFYLAQIPFTEEQVEASNLLIQDGLYHGGVIEMEQIENFTLSERTLLRVVNDFPDFKSMDDIYYHLFLLSLRRGDDEQAETYRQLMAEAFPDSKLTQTISHPRFLELAQHGRHLEDSLYAATYEAYQEGTYHVVDQNLTQSTEDFPEGAHRAKFLFLHAMTQLYTGHQSEFLAELKALLKDHSRDEIAEIAQSIVKGIQDGRLLSPDRWDASTIWSRRSIDLESDSTQTADTLVADPKQPYVFVLAYPTGQLDDNQLLFEMATYNFSNFMARNFEMEFASADGVTQLRVNGFQDYDEVHAYAQQLYSDMRMRTLLEGIRAILISESNLKLLGTRYSYEDYSEFFDQELSPLELPEDLNLDEPADIENIDPDDLPGPNEKVDETEENNNNDSTDDDDSWLY